MRQDAPYLKASPSPVRPPANVVVAGRPGPAQQTKLFDVDHLHCVLDNLPDDETGVSTCMTLWNGTRKTMQSCALAVSLHSCRMRTLYIIFVKGYQRPVKIYPSFLVRSLL